MFFWLGLALALATFAAVATAGSVAVALGWPQLLRIAGPSTARSEARLLLALRLLPAAVALLTAGGLVVSAWIGFEPESTEEPLGGLLLAGAGCGTALLLLGGGRALASWLAASRLARKWAAGGRPVQLAGISSPAYRIGHDFPVVCVLGLLRPRLFVAGEVLDSCSLPELEAVVAHESSHLASRDNLKALLVRALPDAVAAFAAGRALEDAWQRAAESAADERAAGLHPGAAADLAAALVRLARLAAERPWASLPGRALLDGGRVSPRVARLLAGSAAPVAPVWRRAIAWALVLALPAAVLFAAGRPGILRAVHQIEERIVQLG